jgi:hypothetical protein
MRNIHSDQSGFTALELVISAAILMIGVYAAADAMILTAKYQRTATSESELGMIFDRVQGIAGAEWSCTAGLTGSDYQGAITVRDPVDSRTVATEGFSSSAGNFWTINTVRMHDVAAVDGQPGVYRGGLYLEASKNMKIHLGVPIVSRLVRDIYFEINPDGTISRCYTTSDTVAAAQSACELLGGTWKSDGNGQQANCHLPGA